MDINWRFVALRNLMNSLKQMEGALTETAEHVEDADELRACYAPLLAVRRKFWPMYRASEQEQYVEVYGLPEDAQE